MKIPTNYISTLVKSVVVIFTMVTVVSCQKNKDDNPQPEPALPMGYWFGHYKYTGSLEEKNIAVLVKEGGFARIYDMGTKTDTATVTSKWSGTWTLSAETLDVQYNGGEHVLLTGLVDPLAKTWIGTWFKSAACRGTINLKR